jgi:hypothetical protein
LLHLITPRDLYNSNQEDSDGHARLYQALPRHSLSVYCYQPAYFRDWRVLIALLQQMVAELVQHPRPSEQAT